MIIPDSAWDPGDMDIAPSILDLIGKTPMVRMKRVSEEHDIKCTLAMKHEEHIKTIALQAPGNAFFLVVG